MEARDELQTLLLRGLPPDERAYVINKIAEVNEAKRRYLQAQPAPEEEADPADPD
jgi:hypothetical protein